MSRFGRNYLEAGNYIEKIFPFLGVRFIAVADGFDTRKEGNENKQMASEIKNLVNDMYAKDFSKKAINIMTKLSDLLWSKQQTNNTNSGGKRLCQRL